jgi:hypothetical protein
MSDLNHILYTTISFLITIIGLIIFGIFVKKQNHKDLIVKTFAILTLIIHFSTLWTDYFSGNTPNVVTPMILPLYPCNVAMWLLVIVAFFKNKESKIFTVLSIITFYLGIIGGVIGIVFNEIYIATPDLRVWDVLNGLLSHSTMMFGCIYLLVGGYIKIRVSNLISAVFGLILLVADGGLMILLHIIFGLEPPNSMYLLARPFENIVWLNVATIGLMAVALIFLVTALYEQFALPKEDRWYSKIKKHLNKN